MSNKVVSQEAYDSLKEKLDSLQNELDNCTVEKKSFGQWVPECDEKYHYLDGSCGVGCARWTDHIVDTSRLSMWNVFKAKEEAVRERKYRMVRVKVINRIAELNEGWVPDWSKGFEHKYYVMCSHNLSGGVKPLLSVDWGSLHQITENNMYLKSGELARQLINELEDELKIILGV